MKKQIFSLTVFTLLVIATINTGCKKEDDTAKPTTAASVSTQKDTIAPVITLTSPNPQVMTLQETYIELGATAQDAKDGQMAPPISSGTVNINLTGDYIITYTAIDAAGNIATATRTVTVVNDVDIYTGTYNCSIAGSPAHTYTQTITASTTINNRILFQRFKDVTASYPIYAQVIGITLTIPSQTTIVSSTDARTFDGTGALLNSTPLSFSISYNETITLSGSAPSPTAYTETLTKQ
jgi:hypothetical protein